MASLLFQADVGDLMLHDLGLDVLVACTAVEDHLGVLVEQVLRACDGGFGGLVPVAFLLIPGGEEVVSLLETVLVLHLHKFTLAVDVMPGVSRSTKKAGRNAIKGVGWTITLSHRILHLRNSFLTAFQVHVLLFQGIFPLLILRLTAKFLRLDSFAHFVLLLVGALSNPDRITGTEDF